MPSGPSSESGRQHPHTMRRETTISAVILDLDGTLLNSQGRVSEADALALRRCAENGILLCLATARPRRLSLRPEDVGPDMAFLRERGAFYSGAEALDCALAYSRHWMLASQQTSEIVACLIAALADIQIAIQIGEEHHSFRLPMAEAEVGSWGFLPEELVPFAAARQRNCSKIVAWDLTQDLGNAYQALVKTHGPSINVFLTDSRRWVQITSAEATKEKALVDLLSLHGISPEHAVVFGDDAPDAGMFHTFGYSVAMSNANDDLKRAATFVTRSNDEDGVAYALRERFRLL